METKTKVLESKRKTRQSNKQKTPSTNMKPKKKLTKQSLKQVPCQLMPDTSEVSPPRAPRSKKLERLDTSEPCLVVLGHDESTISTVDSSVHTTPRKNSQPVLISSPGIINVPDNIVLDESFIVAADIEMVGFSPCSSPPLPSTSSQCPMPVTSADESVIEFAICDDELEAMFRRCEQSADRNAGSDVDNDVDEEETEGIRIRHAAEFDVEDLPCELWENLQILDSQDDRALRELANPDMLTFDWSHDPQIFTGKREVFTGPSGPTFCAKDMSPFQIFTKIWDEDVINLIVTETNKYGENLRRDPALSQYARSKRWIPITPTELWTFFAILMIQSIIPIPVEREYWTPCLSYLKINNFADFMPYYRFQLIKRCLHFVDNNIRAKGTPNKLTKIKPILDHLNKKFSSLYLPEQEICIDESLMLWKGKLSFAQLIKNKAARVGIKTYELCESKTGYLWKMIVYTGKHGGDTVGEVQADVRSDDEPECATSKIVYSLVRPLLNKGHTLVMDNFYNSPLLARTLKAQHTDVFGTIRLHREFVPESLRNKNKTNMRTGEVAFSHTKDLTITVWKDATTVVALISTYHNVEAGGKLKQGLYKYKPKAVLDYNLCMGGVDKKDQLLQAFPIERIRNSIWYKKFFRRLFNVSIHNAFVMFNRGRTAKMAIANRTFRVKLVDEILQKFRPPKPQEAVVIRTGHFPAKNNKSKARCKWCYMKKLTSSTVWMCDTCNVDLCVIGCFKEYHLSRT